MTAEDRHIKSITVVSMSINQGSSKTIVAYDIREQHRFIGSKVELMQIQCRMCPDAASASAEDLMIMTAEDRHIKFKSITLCMSANCGSRQTIVAYDIREDVCNDS